MKTKFTWKLWIKNMMFSIPLLIAAWHAFSQGCIFGLSIGVIALYVAHLYDLRWQERVKFPPN